MLHVLILSLLDVIAFFAYFQVSCFDNRKGRGFIMKLDRLMMELGLLEKDPNNQQTVRRIGRDIGHELPQNRLEVMREARALIAGTLRRIQKNNPTASFVIGALVVFGEICSAYDAEIREMSAQERREIHE